VLNVDQVTCKGAVAQKGSDVCVIDGLLVSTELEVLKRHTVAMSEERSEVHAKGVRNGVNATVIAAALCTDLAASAS
jgi:hypothetical protein